MTGFKALEVLSLQRNRLEREETLLALSSAPALRELNLGKNYFKKISSAITEAQTAGDGGVGFPCALEWARLSMPCIGRVAAIVDLWAHTR